MLSRGCRLMPTTMHARPKPSVHHHSMPRQHSVEGFCLTSTIVTPLPGSSTFMH